MTATPALTTFALILMYTFFALIVIMTAMPTTCAALILYPFRRLNFWRWYSLYLSSEYWNALTSLRRLIPRYNYCDHCRRKGTRLNPLQTHHRHECGAYNILFRELAHLEKLQTLCKECHGKVK